MYSSKRILRVGLWILACVIFTFASAASIEAQTPSDNQVSFAMLKTGEMILRGTIDSTEVGFSLPASWQPSTGAELRLNFAAVIPGLNNSTASAATRQVGGVLNVSLNGATIGTVLIDQAGERLVTLPISTSLLAMPQVNNRQSLILTLKTVEDCNTEPTSIVVRASSYFVIPHSYIAPTTDLKKLPYPIFQQSFTPDSAWLVMPDQPTTSEMQAGLTVAAGLGRMTAGQLGMTLTTASKLNADLLKSAHLIFVGKPKSLAQLAQTTWPVPIADSGFSGADIAGDDGVIQSIVSPWNNAKVVLWVSGQSDAGVVKAGQALASGVIRSGKASNLAVVANTQPALVQTQGATDRTFADLGYGTQTLWGPGVRWLSLNFDMPYGQAVTGDAYLNLVFNNAAQFDFEQSGVDISLNDEFIGSLRFSERTTQVSSWRLALPPTAFRTGVNTLLVRASLQPTKQCNLDPNVGLRFTVRSESTLHLNYGPAKAVTRNFDLGGYPALFMPTLDRTAFVVAENDPTSWASAAQLAFNLGRNTQGTLIDLAAAYASNVPETVRQQRDLVVIGRPSTLPLIAELNPKLPAPFDAGSDLANEPKSQIQFRFSKDTPLGYLQVLPAPWKSDRAVFAVLGNGDDGLQSAVSALVTPAKQGKLSGNLAVINGDQIVAAQTNPPPANATPVAVTTNSTATANNTLGLNEMVVSGIVVALVVLIVVGILLGRMIKKT